MFEFPPSLISPSSSSTPIPKILVDSTIATMSEAGELIAAKITPREIVEIGEMVDEKGEILVGGEGDRLKKELRIKGMSLFKCVGVGSMDVSIAELVYNRAVELGIGTIVDY